MLSLKFFMRLLWLQMNAANMQACQFLSASDSIFKGPNGDGVLFGSSHFCPFTSYKKRFSLPASHSSPADTKM